jgi:hypothetical protein
MFNVMPEESKSTMGLVTRMGKLSIPSFSFWHAAKSRIAAAKVNKYFTI